MVANRFKPVLMAAGLAALAACATTPPPPAPPPPPPPPPVAVVEAEPIPYRPIPPRGAAYRMDIPARNAAGQRLTVNHDLDESETVWHMRSAWNVAALNCLGPNDKQITDAYGAFLKKFPNGLAAANRELDQRYRNQFGAGNAGIRAREEHSTQVYNYFTLPGARTDLCAVARQVAADFENWEGDDVKAYSALHLPLFEKTYLDFFDEYERYQTASAEWDRLYGAEYGASQPGYVAIYGSQTRSVGEALLTGQPQATGQVIDSNTGSAVPVVPVPDGTVQTPVVQPLAGQGDASEPGGD